MTVQQQKQTNFLMSYNFLFGDAIYHINKNRETKLLRPTEMPLESNNEKETTVSHFESCKLSARSMQKLKPALQEWLKSAECMYIPLVFTFYILSVA